MARTATITLLVRRAQGLRGLSEWPVLAACAQPGDACPIGRRLSGPRCPPATALAGAIVPERRDGWFSAGASLQLLPPSVIGWPLHILVSAIGGVSPWAPSARFASHISDTGLVSVEEKWTFQSVFRDFLSVQAISVYVYRRGHDCTAAERCCPCPSRPACNDDDDDDEHTVGQAMAPPHRPCNGYLYTD